MAKLNHSRTVPFQPEYVALLGGADIHCAVMLSQLVCWYMRGMSLDQAHRVFKDGSWWVAASWQDWQQHFGFSGAQTRRCLTKLKKKGLIEIRVHMFNGAPTRHVRFPWLANGETLPAPPTAAELQHRVAVIKQRLNSLANEG